MDEFVSDEANRAASKSRQSFHRNGSVFFHYPFDHFQTVLDAFGPVGLRAGADRARFSHPAIFHDFDGVAVLANDCARIASNKRVTTEMFPAFDGFKKERFVRSANFAISRKRSFDIGKQAACDWNQIAVLSELAKLFEGG